MLMAGLLLSTSVSAAPRAPAQNIAADSVDAGDYYLGLNGQAIRFHRKKDVYLKLDSIATARKSKRLQQIDPNGKIAAQALRAFSANPAGFESIQNHRWGDLEIIKASPGLQSFASRALSQLNGTASKYAPVFTAENGQGEYLILPDIMISFNSKADAQQYKQTMLQQFGMKIKNQMMFSETDFVLAFEQGIDDYAKVFKTTRDLMALPYIKWAEPNMQVKLQRSEVPNPNDLLYREQWGLENWGKDGALCIADDDGIPPNTGYAADIDANDAWDYMALLAPAAIPVIAIIDDGIQLDHPDLPIINKAISNGNFGGGSNVCFDDPHGCNFGDYYLWGGGIGRTYNRTGPDTLSAEAGTVVPPEPQAVNDTHGTLVAGIAAAKRNNSIGVSGSAYNAEILSVRLDFNAAMDCVSLVDALTYADYYADIISNSWRLDGGAQSLCQSSLDAAITSITGNGTPVLFASGNSAAGWRKITLDLTASDSVIQFAFHKDDRFLSDVGEDAVWIDDIKLPESALEDFDGSWPLAYTLNDTANSPISVSGNVTDYNACSGGTTNNVADTGHTLLGAGQSVKLSTTEGYCSYLTITRSAPVAGSMSFWVWVSAEPWLLQDSPTKLIGDPFRVYIDGTKTSIDLINAATDGVDVEHNSLNELYIYDNVIDYPASNSDVIAVGASNDGSDAYLSSGPAPEDEDRAYFSQYSPNLNVLAPGINIRTTAVGGGYGSLSGTSASTPMVAGVIANMLAISPGISLINIKAFLHDGADKIGPNAGEFLYDISGFNKYYGYGRVNAYKSVQLADPAGIPPPAEALVLCTDPNPGAADDDWLILTMPAILAAALKNKP